MAPSGSVPRRPLSRPALCLALLLGLPLAAMAEDIRPLSVEEFDRLTLGRTFNSIDIEMGHYGTATYGSGHRLQWAGAGLCLNGVWRQHPGSEQICFSFDDAPEDEFCWIFGQQNGQLVGWLAGVQQPGPVTFVETDEPLQCSLMIGV